jgi:hypothetical protein
MTLRNILLLIVGLVLLVGAGLGGFYVWQNRESLGIGGRTDEGSTTVQPTHEVVVREIPFEVYASGVQGGPRRVNRIYDTQAKWDVALAELVVPENLPPVDFEKEILIAAFMGTQSTGGYEVSIGKVLDRGGESEAYVTEYAPGAGCVTAQVVTAPFVVVKTPIINKKVKFFANREVRNC